MRSIFSRHVVGLVVATPQSRTRCSVPFSSNAGEVLSSAPVQDEGNSSAKRRHNKHCQTCTCREGPANTDQITQTSRRSERESTSLVAPCGYSVDSTAPLPPPLPHPKYSVHKRVLPERLIALRSEKGKFMLLYALEHNQAESYWTLMEHFTNQSDPAYCGVTTLLIVLNAMAVDPNIRWRGGWRYYGDEDTLLRRCCIPTERIRRTGITMMEFARLAKCQGLGTDMKQPPGSIVEEFRQDVKATLSSSRGGIIVASFARSALDQTGEGHFSPIAAYYEDYVLVLDVARFKYAPYWVKMDDLYDAMKLCDEATNQPRGWFILEPSKIKERALVSEKQRPAHLVPKAEDIDICPVGKIKVHFCEASQDAKTKPAR